MQRPPFGWTTAARVQRVIDGDTCTLRVERVLRCRLLDCWAPELHKPGGPEAQSYLAGLIAGQHVTLHVPTDEELAGAFSFGRVLGTVFIGDDDVAALMIGAGHAKRKKDRKR